MLRVLESTPTGISAIELFSGCGGMALGFENAGLQTKLLVEKDRACTQTLLRNRPNWNVIHSDISLVDRDHGKPLTSGMGKDSAAV